MPDKREGEAYSKYIVYNIAVSFHNGMCAVDRAASLPNLRTGQQRNVHGRIAI